MLPRYFAASATGPLPPYLPAAAAGIIDAFRVPWGGHEAAVVLDKAGGLHLVDRVPADLPAELREEYLHHELANARPRRAIVADAIWLLAIEGMQQARGAPGLNDPLALDGRLFGPFGTPEAPSHSRGALTITRGDLLAAFVDAEPEAFPTRTLAGTSATCHHALFPGGAPGEGHVVLAYPLDAADLASDDRSNAELVCDLLFDTLAGLMADLREAGSTSRFATLTLPVPDRADVDQALRDDGWIVKGNEAHRRKPVVKQNLDDALPRGLGELLTNALGVNLTEHRTLPSQGSFADYVALARAALSELPDWPSPRYRAMRDALAVGTPVKVPRNAPAQPPPPAPRPPDPWQRDFQPDPGRRTTLHRHTRPPSHPQAPPPAKPAPSRRAPKPSTLKSRPTWLDDFES